MSHAMISAVWLLVGTILQLVASLAAKTKGGREALDGWGPLGFVRPMGWMFLLFSAGFAISAAP